MRIIILIITLLAINNSYAEYVDCNLSKQRELCFSLRDAESGNPELLAKLGEIYWQGTLTQQNEVQSLMWYMLAAKEDTRYSSVMNNVMASLGEDYVKVARKLARKCAAKDFINCDVYDVYAGPYGN